MFPRGVSWASFVPAFAQLQAGASDPEIAVESKPKSREGRGRDSLSTGLLFSADIDGGLGRRGSVGFEEWGREPWRMMRY